MSGLRAKVIGSGLWMPDAGSLQSWLDGAGEDATPAGTLIERRSRRRSSEFTRALADSYAQALETSGANPAEVSAVFGSALGEVSTMVGLLDQMWREAEPLSPMAFAMSVHNAAAGVVSISTANQGYTTSSGADFDTPAMSLFEAFGLVAGGDTVIVTVGDESVPEKLVHGDAGWSMLTAAVALAPVDADVTGAATITLPERVPATLEPATLSPTAARNPCAGMIDLISALARGEDGRVALDRGRGRGWSVELTFG